MKAQQYIAGVLLIALLVAGAILTMGSRLTSLFDVDAQEAVVEGQAETGQLPSSGAFQIEKAPYGKVQLDWAAPGELGDDFTPPTAEELATLPNLGTLDLAFLLQSTGGANVRGFVELETSVTFTGYHTIDTTVVNSATTLIVGPQVEGVYDNGQFYLVSERVPYITDSGEAVERQFVLLGSPGDTPGALVGEYRETVWGIGFQPFTVVGTFELTDLNVKMASLNQPPVVDSLGLTTPKNTAVAATLLAGDLEQSPLTYSIVAQPTHGTLSGTAPNLTYTPNTDYTGTDTFTFKVNDGTADSNTEGVFITVLAGPGENNPPTANAQTVNAVTAQAKSITLTGSDLDGNTLSFAVVAQPTNGTLSGTAPNVTYTSNAGFVGADSFTFKVNDGTVDSPTVTVTINVTAPTGGGNTTPTANAQTVNVVAGQATAVTLVGIDADSDTLTFIIVSQPTNGTLTGTPPNLTYTPNAGFVGTDSFTYKVNDGTADSETVTVTIVVTGEEPTDEEDKIFLPITIK